MFLLSNSKFLVSNNNNITDPDVISNCSLLANREIRAEHAGPGEEEVATIAPAQAPGKGFRTTRSPQCHGVVREGSNPNNMKLPFSKDGHDRSAKDECTTLCSSHVHLNRSPLNRMATSPDVPRRELLYEIRETSLLGNGTPAPRLMVDKAIQFEAMELNDTSEYNGGASITTFSTPSPPVNVETTIISEWSPSSINESTLPVHQRDASSDETIKSYQKELATAVSSTSEAPPPAQPPPPTDDGPRYKINQSNPTSPTGPGDASTWRIRDRDRDRHSSGSEDDIEKMEDTLPGLSYGACDETDPSKAKGAWKEGDSKDRETSQAQSKDDATDSPPADDGDCLIECLSYTLQCCECVIS